MITHLYSTGPYLQVISGGVSSLGYGPHDGELRVGPTGQLEMFRGGSYLTVSNPASVGLSVDAERAITWVLEQMKKEEEARKLAQEFPAIQHALDDIETAKQRLEMTMQLVKTHDA